MQNRVRCERLVKISGFILQFPAKFGNGLIRLFVNEELHPEQQFIGTFDYDLALFSPYPAVGDRDPAHRAEGIAFRKSPREDQPAATLNTLLA